MEPRDPPRAASSPSDLGSDWDGHSRKQADSRHDRERDVDDVASKSSSVVTYTRTARHGRTTHERSSSSRYADQCVESKYRTHGRRSSDREYLREADESEEYFAHSSSRSGRHHVDHHSYYSSSHHQRDHHHHHHSHSSHANHHAFRSETRDRQRRSPSEARKRSYRGETYSRPLDREDQRVRNDAPHSYHKSSSEKLSSSLRSSCRLRTEESRSSHHATAASSPRYSMSSRRSAVVRTLGDWEEHVSSNNKLYYYNRVSGVSQWEPPRDLSQYQSDRRSKSPVGTRQRTQVPEDADSDDEAFERKRHSDDTRDSRSKSHVTYQRSLHTDASLSRSSSRLQSDCHSRSHSLLERSSSVQSRSSSTSSPPEGERRRAQVNDATLSSKGGTDQSRVSKRKATEAGVSQADTHAISENGIRRRVTDSNGFPSLRKKVLAADSIVKQEGTSVLGSRDAGNSSSCRSQCLSPSQVTMDNLEKIIDSLADTPGLPDLRKLSREDALKTIQQVLRIMKEASLGIPSRTPTTLSPSTQSCLSQSASSSHAGNSSRSRPLVVRSRSSNQGADHEPAINGGAVFLSRQDLTIPSPSSEISGYSSTRSPSDSGVDIPVPSKPSVPSLTTTLASFFREDLIKHVQDWPADHLERQANRLAEEAHSLGSRDCTRVSAELKMARSLVRLTEIQATLQEQRILFVRQQIKDVESWRSAHTSVNSSGPSVAPLS